MSESAWSPSATSPWQSSRATSHCDTNGPSSRSRAGFPARDNTPASQLPSYCGHDAVMIRGMPRVGPVAVGRSCQTPDPGIAALQRRPTACPEMMNCRAMPARLDP
jgi:hypothetical protein